MKIHYKGKSSDIVPLSQIHLWSKESVEIIKSKVLISPDNKDEFTIEFDNVAENQKVNLSFGSYNFNDYTLLDTVEVK